jgi:diguanylate cyclase (GGDEF)-like protein/PAS domain S-box-containing protein
METKRDDPAADFTKMQDPAAQDVDEEGPLFRVLAESDDCPGKTTSTGTTLAGVQTNAPVSTLAKRPATSRSTTQRLCLVFAAVFGIEAAIMVGLHFFVPVPDVPEGFADATLLTLALLPLLYYQLFRPLVSQERRIRGFIENALDIAWIITTDGKITDVTPSVERALGYKTEEFTGKAASDFVHPDDLPKVAAAIAQTLSGPGPGPLLDVRMRHHDGSWRILEAQGSAFFDARGAPISVINARDVTERKRVEEDLRQREDLLRNIVYSSPVPIVALDRHGLMTAWSPAAERTFGWKADEVLGKAYPLAPGEKQAEFREILRQVLTSDGGLRADVQRQRKDGAWVDVDLTIAPLREVGGEAVGVVGMLVDITERRRREAADRVAKDRLAMLSSAVEKAADSIFITDFDGVIQYVNPSFEQLTGYSSAEAVGKTPRILKSGKRSASFYSKLWRTIQGGKPFSVVTANRKKNGELYYEEKVITPVHDDRGRITHFVSTGRDITRQRHQRLLSRKQSWVLEMIAGRRPLPMVLARICRLMESTSSVTMASVWVLDPRGGALRMGAGPSLPDNLRRALDGIEIDPSALSCGVVQVADSPVWGECRDLALAYDLHSTWSENIVSDDGILLGMIVLWDREPGERRSDDREPFRIACSLAAIAIQHDSVEVSLHKSEEEQRTLIETARDVIYTLSTDGTLLSLNSAFETMSGWPRSEWIGRPFASIICPDDLPVATDTFRQLLAGEEAPIVECRVLTKSGQMTVAEFNGAPLLQDGAVVGILGVARDITERKRAEETIRHLAYHDGLTDLPNRALFNDRLTTALAQVARGGRAIAALLIDLDNFKLVNDSVGHDQGDQLLRAIASDLGKLMREGDTLARVGGDEFSVLIRGAKRSEDVVNLAQRVLRCIAQPRVLGGREFRVTGSAGIAVYPADGEDAEGLMHSTDLAMYRAKALGRNNCQLFNETMNAEVRDRIALEEELRRALDRGEFVLHYQPIVEVESGRITSAEALIRWEHPERGLVPPLEFIPFAEETGLILPIGEWVLRTACAQGRRWQDAGLSIDRVAVNVSVLQFRRPDFVETVRRILAETGLEPSRLELEITESIAMEDAKWSQQSLGALNAMGIRITIDDFGTGHSSLAYLKAFPIRTLKIDRTFIRDVTTDADDDAIAITIIGLAHTLGFSAIAEGVETEEQMAFLREHRCDEFQGFLFARPGPAAVVEELVERWTSEWADKPGAHTNGSANSGSAVLQTARNESRVMP